MQTALGTVAFVSLGCPKNLIDSETMLGSLASEGFTITPNYKGADVVVINTCGFLDASRRESLDTISKMLELKEKGDVKRVVVAGCMVGNYRDLLQGALTLENYPLIGKRVAMVQFLGMLGRER